MFDMDNLHVLVGKQASDPVIQAFLRCAQLPDPPKITRADSNVYLDKEAEGVSALFEAADFAAVEGDDVFSVFQGTLLNGISFDMDRAVIASRMGPSTLFNEAFNAKARGIGNGVRIFLDYDDAFKKIKLIQIGLVLARDMVK
ncbi:hypothetical protein [Burkholderia ubonensis]|uniref:hypothetical protein n=1 Tax=Burkholderia ubonensis TaxID=101571 RepID=UPI00076C1CC4|nr:hypothetical protein [Burkholderia ubonensis]KWI92226.1 hypothetical protein WM09_08750 [Burkholderia ubonensis]